MKYFFYDLIVLPYMYIIYVIRFIITLIWQFRFLKISDCSFIGYNYGYASFIIDDASFLETIDMLVNDKNDFYCFYLFGYQK